MNAYAVINPATGATEKTFPTMSTAELDAAINLADKVYRTRSRTTTVDARAALIRRVGELYVERSAELADVIVREMGKPRNQAVGEVRFSASIYAYYADNAAALLADEPIELKNGSGSALIRKQPIGVLLGIMPWNFPYYQVARFSGPNLMLGNTMLLKHAPQCPESAAAMEHLFQDAGFPRGAYVNIYAANEQIEHVIADPRVQGVSVTGSQRAGAAVAQLAGKYLKKVVLELGGSDPFLLLSTDDMAATVKAAVRARMNNSGQACNAAKRFIVIDKLYDDFVQKFTAAMA
ncbi:MAG: aldehyde dehydrogenase family protein, partial [Rhodanobacteraceae bacterium]